MILNVRDLYTRRVLVGNYVLCEVDLNLQSTIDDRSQEIILDTGTTQWIELRYRKQYRVEIDNEIRFVWLGKLLESRGGEGKLKTVPIVYARCGGSMSFLDRIHRKYISKTHKFNKNQLLAIKAVAGSGKTTTLIDLANNHPDKKILYLAFNRALIDEIRKKAPSNLKPRTFDSLMREVFILKKGFVPEMIDLKPHSMGKMVDWFNTPKAYYKTKMCYAKRFAKFCQQTEFDNIDNFSRYYYKEPKRLLRGMWDCDKVYTFDGIRKMAQVNHWCRSLIDEKYDMVFIDEAQDFDMIMLSILLEDVTLPLVFVGDPLQAIYEWRGCINAFDELPDTTLCVEFYSTFRIGEPACSQIKKTFGEDCWMMSKCERETTMTRGNYPTSSYVYLFRSWKSLLQEAQEIPNVWINNYDKQVITIKKLHKSLQKFKLSKEEIEEFSDDLPLFLVKLKCHELEELINNIERNLVPKEQSICQMYTIHSYKGLENDIVKVHDDIDLENERNIHYVALTRGMSSIHH